MGMERLSHSGEEVSQVTLRSEGTEGTSPVCNKTQNTPQTRKDTTLDTIG